MEYASTGTANTALGLGIAGTALGILGSGQNGLLGGLFGGGQNYVSKESFELSMQLNKSEMEKAILSADLNTEKKIVESVTAINDKINKVVADQNAINTQQAVTNTAVTANIAVMQNNINQLMGMTKLVIPYKNVCPIPAIANPQPTDEA